MNAVGGDVEDGIEAKIKVKVKVEGVDRAWRWPARRTGRRRVIGRGSGDVGGRRCATASRPPVSVRAETPTVSPAVKWSGAAPRPGAVLGGGRGASEVRFLPLAPK